MWYTSQNVLMPKRPGVKTSGVFRVLLQGRLKRDKGSHQGGPNIQVGDIIILAELFCFLLACGNSHKHVHTE